MRVQGWMGLALAMALCGCAAVTTRQLRPAAYSVETERHAGELTAEEETRLAELCPFGTPKESAFYASEPLTLIVRGGYAIQHNDATKTPVWVCERVTNADAHGPLRGRDSWRTDPKLCDGSLSAGQCTRGAVDDDYKGSGFDRGHLAPNMNQRRDRDRKQQTFYFSNAAPQVGRTFNQSAWQDLETELAAWVQDLDAFWTITGVLYHEDAEEDPATADGVVEVTTIGDGAVFVPTHFYKVVVWETPQGPRAMTVVMKNEPRAHGDSFRNHLQSVRWLEQRLQVDFMPDLEPADADALETVVGTPFR